MPFFRNGANIKYAPVDGYLKAGTQPTFKILVPNAMKVVVIQGEELHALKRGAEFEDRVKVKPGEIRIGAMFFGERRYHILLSHRAYWPASPDQEPFIWGFRVPILVGPRARTTLPTDSAASAALWPMAAVRASIRTMLSKRLCQLGLRQPLLVG